MSWGLWMNRVRLSVLWRSVIVAGIALASHMACVGPASATTPTYTTNYVWDTDSRLTMVIQPDPGTGVRVATRYVYDANDQLIETDTGTTPNGDGTSFSATETTTYAYDGAGNKIQTQVLNGTATPALGLTQMGYDADDRPTCTAVRMNSAAYGALAATVVSGSTTAYALPTGACTLGTAGTLGNDRITELNYDAAGQKTSEIRALGVSGKQITYEAFSYTADGKTLTIDDADGNRTTYAYDGYDRLITTQFPVTTPGQYASDSTDYESYTYDANDNRLTLRKRDGNTISYTYDNLNRERLKSAPAVGPAVAYQVTTTYDLLNHKLSALFAGGAGVSYSYDVAGRMLTETAGSLTLTSTYDAAGNRSKLTWPDGFAASYVYDADNHLTAVTDFGAGITLASFYYDSLGRRGGATVGAFTNVGVSNKNGTSTSYAYDNADRLTSLGQNLATNAQTIALAYNPASQILSRAGSNTAYDYVGYQSGTTNKAYDGLNRDGTISALGTLPGGTACSTTTPSYGYDANGSLLYDGLRAVCYDAENRLISASIPSAATTASLSYDPSGRLQTYQTTVNGTNSTTTFLYDGDRLSAEYNGSTLLRRYVHGVGTDVPLVWYEGATGSTDRRWLHVDNQGSIIAWSNSSGNVSTTSYGAYGEPTVWSGSRFSYTGQIMLPEIRLYHYKARVYDPATGRFMQTDPVGYDAGPNLYEYVEDDPTDKTDPMGDCPECLTIAIGAGGGAIAGFVGQVAADVVTGEVSSPQAYLGSTLGGAAGGAVFGATGNAALAGATGGAVGSGVTAGIDAALKPGATLGSVASATGKAAVIGGAVGGATGAAGKFLAAGGKGIVAKVAQKTAVGRAIANNEKMTTMMAGKIARGAQTSEKTGYKMVGGAATAGAGAAAASSTACKTSGQC
jgi:RHS repeat-associated protein